MLLWDQQLVFQRGYLVEKFKFLEDFELLVGEVSLGLHTVIDGGSTDDWGEALRWPFMIGGCHLVTC